MGVLSKTMAERYGQHISEEQETLLVAYLREVMEANKTINLTRIVSEESGMVLHLEDSLVALPYVENAPEGLYGDMGTGGGFPGVPLAITTGRETVLIDSTQKKIRVVLEIVEKLAIEHVEGYAGRIEDLGKERRGCFSVLTARAVSSLPSLMELASPLLKKHGQLVCYKAQPDEEEVAHAASIERMVGLRLIEDENLVLSDGSQRRLFVFEKNAPASVSLPRRVGLAQKQPLHG